MRVGSLFTGIGGLDLGLERAGMTVAWQSEIDPYASRVLAKHWPHVPNLGDITTIDWSTVEPVDLICGGYPCQPFSLAGARNGTDDPRHLWPHFARSLRSLRPEWALLENVPGHLSLGFDDVQADLADLGYDTEWECIPAAAVGAPHLRFRLFVVAHAGSQRRLGRSLLTPLGRHEAVWSEEGDHASHSVAAWPMADADGWRQQEPEDQPTGEGPVFVRSYPCRRGWWATEPGVCGVAHGVPARVDRLRALGNAVVPQVAEYIGRRIMESAA